MLSTPPNRITPEWFQKRFIGLILLTWLVPPFFGLSFLMFIKMFSASQMVDILTSPIEPLYCIAALLFAAIYFNRYAKPVYDYIEDPGQQKSEQVIQCIKAFPIHFWGIFLTYLVLAPITVIFSAEIFSDFIATPVDWFRINLVALIVSIIVGLPIFFLILDLFGKIMSNITLSKPHITIKTKVFLIGALVPLLIDTMLVQYYWTRTGYFTFETFIVWLTLEVLAICGSLIFVRSFGQSLQPLRSAIESSTGIPRSHYRDMNAQSTDELGVLTRKYRELLDNLYDYQVHLEEKVEQRTHDLAEANKELEAFTYSVSHDLRAPLRAINGYSSILLNDYLQSLDSEGKKFVMRINSNVGQMTHLIDDLLNLSRVTSQELQLTDVDMSMLAKERIGFMQEQHPGHPAHCRVGENLITRGDERLLMILLNNLLSNAWKYSSKTDKPEIEFDYSKEKSAFFVKDNGVGFDMKYAEKLFIPFQRLHNNNEYEGFGVGLATAHRIVKRHNGSIWADSLPGNGTTFFFTVNQESDANDSTLVH